MKRVWKYFTKRHNKISILWKHMLMMVCILALALLALVINNRQSQRTLTADNIGKFQIALDRDCAALGENMHRTVAIPAGVEGTRYYDYIRSVTTGHLEDKYYPVLNYLRKALNNQVYLQGDSTMTVLFLSGCGSAVANDGVFPTAQECFARHIQFSETGTETILGYLRERGSITFLPIQPVKLGLKEYTPCLGHIIHPTDTNVAVMSIYTLDTVLEALGFPYLPEESGLRLTQDDGRLLLQYPEDFAGDKGYFRLDSTLTPYDIQVSLWIPESYFTELLRPVYLTGILSVVFVTVLGLGLSFLLSQVSVKPIRQLLSDHGAGDTSEHGNEIAGLDQLLKSSRQRTEELQSRLTNQILSGAFSGVVLSEREEQLLKKGLEPFPETFRVAILHTDEQVNSILGIRLESLFPNMLWTPMNPRETGVLFPGSEEQVAKLTMEVSRINDQLPEGQCLCCGVSGIAQNLGSLHTAVRQARTALPQQGGTMLFPEKRISPKAVSWLQQERLYKSIFSNDAESALKLLQEMMLLTDNANVREVFYNVRFVLRSAAEEMELPPLVHGDTEYAPNLMARENMQNLEAMLRDLFEKIGQKRSQKASTRRERIMEYIRENFSDYRLCATVVADEYMLSEKRIYEIVREMTGMSFNEYLLQLRMKQAALLLVSTEDSINEIAERCGYQGFSTFYRVFKRHYGVAPGQFRAGQHSAQE